MKSYYIAGPITGTTDYKERFAEAGNELRALGHNPVSPLQPGNDDMSDDAWREYLKLDIRTLLNCDGIYLLDNWYDSRGARLEHLVADALALDIIYQSTERRKRNGGAL